jgi:hypothetical protein
VEAAQPTRATYCWHADAAAAWWVEDGWALIARDDARLWLTCSQGRLGGDDLQRLPGSRGQLSLVFAVEGAGPVVWWVFALAADRPTVDVEREGRQIHLLDQTFSLVG